MPRFTINSPVTTTTSTIQVDGAALGAHRYQLVVEDESGNQSQPAFVSVAVAAPQPQTRVIQVGPSPAALAGPANTDECWVVCSGQVEGTRGAVAVANLSSGAVSRLIVGVAPAEIAVSPPLAGVRRIALVTNSGDNTATALDVAQHSVISTIQVGPRPLGVDISPDGRFGYVVNSGSAAAAAPNGSLTAIDLGTLKVIATAPLGISPERVVFSPAGQEAYVNNAGDGTITVIGVATHKPIASIKVGGAATSRPRQAAVCAATFPVWTANQGTSNASRIAPDRSVQDVAIGFAPEAVVTPAKGDLALLAGSSAKTMAVLDSRSGTLDRHSITLPGEAGGPGSMVLSASQGSVVIAHPQLDRISVFDTAFFNQLLSPAVPKTPVRCALAANGKFACVACQNASSIFVMELAVFP
jgi:YVTN family beta-propeller protein